MPMIQAAAGLDLRRRNGPVLLKVPLAAVKDLRRYCAGISCIRGPKAKIECRILADRNIGFDLEHQFTIVLDFNLLHEIRRDVIVR